MAKASGTLSFATISSVDKVVLRQVRSWAALALLGAGVGCATAPGAGTAGAARPTVYRVRVSTVNGQPTATRGSVSNPACTLQLGNRVVQVWIAHPSRHNAVSPVIMEADEATLKAGVLIERSWNEAIVREISDAELASGVAVVYIPSIFHMTTVELGFEPVGGKPRLGTEDDLAKGGAGLDEPVPRRNVSKR
jgi:hypothetical protein